jgi:hypothetical protein
LITVRRFALRWVTSEIDFDTPQLLLKSKWLTPARRTENAVSGCVSVA